MNKQSINPNEETSPQQAYNAFVAQRLRQLAVTWQEGNSDAQFLHSLADIYCPTGKEVVSSQKKYSRLSTGLTCLDKFTKGLTNGDLMVVGGHKKQGKTAFALSLVNHICLENQVPTVFFSLNTAKEDFLMRLISLRSLTSAPFLQTGCFPPAPWAKTMQAYKEVSRAPLFVDDSPSLSVSQVYLRACLLADNLKKQGKKLGFIVVDSAHLLRGNGEQKNDSQNTVGEMLKSLATALQVPVLVLPQLVDGCANIRDGITLKNKFLEETYWKAADVLGILGENFAPVFREAFCYAISLYLVRNSHGPLERFVFQFYYPYSRYVNVHSEKL